MPEEANSKSDNWMERLAKVKAARARLENYYGDSDALAVLEKHIADEKWEIRQCVADAIPLLPESRLTPFIPLCKDCNHYVSNSAQQAMERRNMFVAETKKRERRRAVLFQNSEKLRKKYGPEAAELARKDADQAYAMMVGQVAHDIRTVLTPIKFRIQRLPYLTEGKLPINEQLEMRVTINELREHTEMMERLTEDVLTLVRKTPEKRTLENLRDLLKTANDMVSAVFNAKERDVSCIAVKLDIPQDITCRVVRDLMLRVFSNLLKNAYESFWQSNEKFKPGQIDVLARKQDSGVEIEIRDNGKGMSPADLRLIRQFKLFRTLKSYGTGFGLAIAYEKIHDHNGSLTIDSVENVGTVVNVFLPNKER